MNEELRKRIEILLSIWPMVDDSDPAIAWALDVKSLLNQVLEELNKERDAKAGPAVEAALAVYREAWKRQENVSVDSTVTFVDVMLGMAEQLKLDEVTIPLEALRTVMNRLVRLEAQNVSLVQKLKDEVRRLQKEVETKIRTRAAMKKQTQDVPREDEDSMREQTVEEMRAKKA